MERGGFIIKEIEKISTKILILITIFSLLSVYLPTLSLVAFATDTLKENKDKTGPVIESIKLSAEQVSPGETLKVTIIATDESNISEISLTYTKGYNGSGMGKTIIAEKQDDGSYVGNIKITNSFFSDYYRISTHAVDEYGNTASITRDAIFKVIGGIDDISGPIIESIELSKEEVSPGDFLEVKIFVTDESEVEEVSLYYNKGYNGNGQGKTIKAEKLEDGSYIANIEITEMFFSDYYRISTYAEDIYGNTASISRDAIFKVTGGIDDITGPEMTIITDKIEAHFGDTIVVNVKVDDESPISIVNVGYYIIEPGVYFYKSINIELEELDNNNYVGKINISENHNEGKYLISGIAEDIYGNTLSKGNDAVFYVGHNWEDFYTIDKESTCIEKGEKSIHCSLCDAVKEGTEIDLELKEHDWNEGEITKEPTNTETGIKTYTCKECGTTKTEKIDVLKYSINGIITSFLNENEDITIQLIEKEKKEPSYEKIVTGNIVKYSIEDVLAGTYKLKILKANHITREYEIIVNNSNVTQDVKICLIGDANGDGRVNNKDWNRLYNHINETNMLIGYELLCADINKDGKVNNKDWTRLYNHINEINPIW